MEQLPHCSGDRRRAGRCRLEQLSTVHCAPTNQTPFCTNAHTVTQGMTSSVTRVSCWKSPNRGELPHFCCCLHRRRVLLKKWSRRHREEAPRPSVAGQGDSSLPRLHIRQPTPSYNTLSQHDNQSLLDTSFYDISRASAALKDDTKYEASAMKERLQCEMCLSTDILNKLFRSKHTSNVVCSDSGGAEKATPRCPPASLDAPLKPEDLDFHARLHPSIPRCTGVILGRSLLDLAAKVSRVVPSAVHTVRRLAGGSREGRLGGRLGGRCESRTLMGLNPAAAQMSFHRWVIVLLVCIMVLPVNSTAAPGLPWGGDSVVEEAGNEPGYKNSFYQVLPPKAEYESVIICLLAVSAFIGLIVWVLKSNFEERQQKRMRREASLRERTSSVAFLKT